MENYGENLPKVRDFTDWNLKYEPWNLSESLNMGPHLSIFEIFSIVTNPPPDIHTSIGVASTLQLGGPHIVKDEMQVEDQLSMLNWGVLPWENYTLILNFEQ